MALTTVKLTAGVTGTLPIANGGTNSTSTTFVNLASNVTGTMPVANGGTAITSGFVNGGALSVADQWRLTTSFTGDADPIASNLEQIDNTNQGTLGSAMTESSGVFTFPSTGIWWVTFNGQFFLDGDDRSAGVFLKIAGTTAAQKYTFITNNGSSGNNYAYASCNTLVDVADVSVQTVSFRVVLGNQSTTVNGGTDKNSTAMTFIRLGDT